MIEGPEPLRFEPAADEASKLERYTRQLSLPGFARYRQQKTLCWSCPCAWCREQLPALWR
jgi:hypothetical protein